jgi:hypothetical protein
VTGPARLRSALPHLAVVLLLFAGGGAVAGLVWEWVWTPPVGTVSDGRWLLDGDALRDDVSGTALYVLVAAAAGLLLGVLAGLLSQPAELVTLAGVVLGSVLAAWLMLEVGQAMGPADPRALAQAAGQGARLPGRLAVEGESPFVAFPTGALVGLLVVLVGVARHPSKHG